MRVLKRLELSAVVHTFNEEKNIKACLEALSWVDEIIVVDMYSTDKTVELARLYTDQIYFFENTGYADPARNFALSKATKDWILVVDADERVTEALKQEIIGKVLTGSHLNRLVAAKYDPGKTWLSESPIEFSAYFIPVADYRFGRWMKKGPGSPQDQLHIRLIRKGKCYWPPEVHSRVRIDGPMSILQAALLHFSHLEIAIFINKLNKYTTFEAQERFEAGKSYNWFNTALVTLHQVYSVYFKQKAYSAGSHGLIITGLMVIYTFIYRAKLWELHYKSVHPDPLTQHEPLAGSEKIDRILEQYASNN